MEEVELHNPIYTKEEFLTNPELLSMPWHQSPFYKQLIESSSLSLEDKNLCMEFAENGFVVIDLDVDEKFMSELVDSLLDEKGAAYFYNPQTIRYFEAWKYSSYVRELALNKKIMHALKVLYGREAVPFQTINFITASEQDVHSDTIHFHTVPNYWMAGVWVALEEMSEANGTLQYIKGSHRLPVMEFHKMNMSPPEWSHVAGGKEQRKYDTYEEFVKAIIEVSGLERVKYVGPAGKAIIWAANTLHGGTKLTDKTKTRKSQVTHYYFKDMPGVDGTQKYYCPMYSEEVSNNYALKNLDEKDIVGLHNSSKGEKNE